MINQCQACIETPIFKSYKYIFNMKYGLLLNMTHHEELMNNFNKYMKDTGKTWCYVADQIGLNYRILSRFAKDDGGLSYENGMKLSSFLNSEHIKRISLSNSTW
jgi:hypothetical protein